MRKTVSWAAMGIIGIVIIVVGIEGTLGKMLGCILTPAIIGLNE